MNKVSALLFAAVFLLTSGGLAQQRAPVPPYLNKLPAFAQWTIAYDYQKAKSDAAADPAAISGGGKQPVIMEIVTTKLDTQRRSLVTWDNGKTTEMWFTGMFSLVEKLGLPDIYIFNNGSFAPIEGAGDTPKDIVQVPDFPELAWIAADNYVDTIVYKGKKCLHFQTKEKNQAWIDQETRLPSGLVEGSLLRIYTFAGSDFPRPAMPERFAKVLQDYKARADQSKHLMKVKP